jgi:hypothetical protein
MLTEELVRNRMKRENILNDKISEIIDRQKLLPQENEIIFFGKNKDDFEKLNELYHKEKHLYIRDIQVFDTLEPKYYGINKEYMDIGTTNREKVDVDPISIYWTKILGENYTVTKTKDSSLFDAIAKGISYQYGEDETPSKLRKKISDTDIPENIIYKIAKDMNLSLEDNSDDENEALLVLYKEYNHKMYKNINSINELKSYISKSSYYGSLVDIYILSYMYNINFIILDKRLKKDTIGMNVIKQIDSSNYIILYTEWNKERYLCNIIGKNGKYVFQKYDLSDRFRALINEFEDKGILQLVRTIPTTRKIKIKKTPLKKKIKIKKIPTKKRIKMKVVKKYTPVKKKIRIKK